MMVTGSDECAMSEVATCTNSGLWLLTMTVTVVRGQGSSTGSGSGVMGFGRFGRAVGGGVSVSCSRMTGVVTGMVEQAGERKIAIAASRKKARWFDAPLR